jgi:hypothetical protein
MKSIRYALLSTIILTGLLTCSTTVSAQITLTNDCIDRVAAFDFFVDSIVPTKPQNVRQAFIDIFCSQVPKIEAWATKHSWQLPQSVPRMKILIGEHYQLERSLVPAWEGDRGRIEIPARRAIPHRSDGLIRADIAHEIFHVYFPNGNRMLAEGIAVYVQDEVMKNPAYPNFGVPVHDRVFCDLYMPGLLQMIGLSKLDAITTPISPMVSLPSGYSTEDQQQAAYLISGSFVRYLIETYTMDKFRELYSTTPFQVGRHVNRTRDNWTDVYMHSLDVLEVQWKAMISQLVVNCSSLTPVWVKEVDKVE